jgi:hypothetical protein
MSEQLTTLAEKPPVSVWKRLFVGAGLFVVALIILAAIQYRLQRSRDNEMFQKALAELDDADPGWRLEDIENARPIIPDEPNSAIVVLAANRLLPPTGFKHVTVMRLFVTRPPQLFDTQQMNLLEKELTAAHAGVVEARRLADMPAGRHPRDYMLNPVDGLGKHAQVVSPVVEALRYDALHLAQKNQPGAALRSCRAMLNAARTLDDDSQVVSQMARCSGPWWAAAAIARTLSLGVPATRDLAELQKLAEGEEPHNGYLIGQRGKRARVHELLDGLIKETVPIEGVYSNDHPVLGWRVKYGKWMIRSGIRREYPHLLALHNRAVEIARLPLHEQAVAEKELKDQIDWLSPRLVFVNAWMPVVNHFGQSFRDKVAGLRCLTTLLALERFRDEQGTWPARLEELIPKLIQAVPLDPHDGKPLRYKKLPDGVVVYSVGPDGIDDGGLIDGAMRTATGIRRDVGLRLWDVKHRRQPPLEKAP